MSKQLLEDVAKEEVFYVNDGSVLNNLFDLLDCLKRISPEEFEHHVNKSKNDFAGWLKSAVGDSVLSDRISGVVKQDQMFRLVHQRIEELTPKKEIVQEVKKEITNHDMREDFTNFLLGLLIGFIIGLIIKTLV